MASYDKSFVFYWEGKYIYSCKCRNKFKKEAKSRTNHSNVKCDECDNNNWISLSKRRPHTEYNFEVFNNYNNSKSDKNNLVINRTDVIYKRGKKHVYKESKHKRITFNLE